MIKLTVQFNLTTEEWEEKFKILSIEYAKKVEIANDMNMIKPEPPALDINQEDIEVIKYAKWLDPNDIKAMTRANGLTLLEFYDHTTLNVKESPNKIIKLKKEYNETNFNNPVRIFNIQHINMPGGYEDYDEDENL